MSVFNKIFTRIVFSFIALTVLLGGFSFVNLKRVLTDQLINSGLLLSQSIADELGLKMVMMDAAAFQDSLNKYASIPNIRYIYITNENNEVILDTFSPQAPPEITTAIRHHRTVLFIPSLQAIEVTHGILYGKLGYVHVGMNTDVIVPHLLRTFPLIILVIMGNMALCLWMLHRVIKTVTHPLNTLTEFTKQLERHQFDISKSNQQDIEQIAQINDEIGVFAKNYLSLHRELQHHVQQLTDASAKNSAIKKELSIARDIQMHLLDQEPQITHSDRLTFSAYISPATDVGGDFYDVVEKGDTVFVVIGDVSGKGVSAALVMAATLTSIRTALGYLSDPTDIITTVNQQISKYNPDMMFVSLFFAAINVNTGTMEYVNAGHPSPLIYNGSITPLPSTNCPVIGIQEHHYYPSNHTQLTPDSVMIMYTDGVTEAHNAANELFGERAINETLQALISPSADTCTHSLKVALETFTNGVAPHDDITILSLRFLGPRHTEVPNPLIISFKNDVNELIKLQHVVGIFSNAHRLNDGIEKRINLVLEELLTNTIFYGYHDNDVHTIFVQFAYENNTVTIRIEDDGIPFNPLTDAPAIDTAADSADRPIGGLGVHLVKTMVDTIHYQRINEKNQLIIVKDIS